MPRKVGRAVVASVLVAIFGSACSSHAVRPNEEACADYAVVLRMNASPDTNHGSTYDQAKSKAIDAGKHAPDGRLKRIIVATLTTNAMTRSDSYYLTSVCADELRQAPKAN